MSDSASPGQAAITACRRRLQAFEFRLQGNHRAADLLEEDADRLWKTALEKVTPPAS